MARRRGWAGSPPTDDQDARDRIVQAAARCVDLLGPAFSLSEVANLLRISRPTVYRYFSSTDELFSAVGQFTMEEFSDQLRAHLDNFTDPAEWIVEGIATPVEWLPSRPHLMLLLTAGRSEPFARGFTSPVAVDMTRQAFRASGIDWSSRGLNQSDIDDLIDLMHRLIASMLIDPPNPPLTSAELRRYLRRFITPAVANIVV